MNKDITLEDLGYIKDEEPNYTSEVSYARYCQDGCCRLNEILFYQKGFECDECFMSYDLFQAIYNKCKELGYLDE